VGEPPSGAAVFTAPRKTSTGSPDELLKGVLVGAALVLAGVAAGALASRRRS